ncbi:hypothetical protein [Actinomadura flavalba]|uniref:hypothetical protein n=1 Tax=Actinomadura flavalba TaxID=1120938 RepID=UPI001969AE9D|nr:hypothetical protein [Actinomadura flavalba]
MADSFLTGVDWTGTVLTVAGTLTGAPGPLRLRLREREDGRVIDCPGTCVTAAPDDGAATFRAELAVATADSGGPLPRGLWDLLLVDGAEIPVGPLRDPALDLGPHRAFLPGGTTVTAYLSLAGTLALDVGGDPHAAGTVPARRLAWNDADDELVVGGEIPFEPGESPVSATMALRERRTGRVYEVIAALHPGPACLGFTASVPLTRAFVDDPLPRGVWDVYLVLGFAGLHRELRVLAPGEPIELQVWRRLHPVRVTSTRAPEPLAVTVGRFAGRRLNGGAGDGASGAAAGPSPATSPATSPGPTPGTPPRVW